MTAATRYIADRTREEDRGYATPCLVWQLKTTEKGYARAVVPGVGRGRVHRIAYELRFGPVPDGLQLDHLCRVPACCNPEYLELVTPAENVRRGNAARPRLTHCHKGHERTPENTYPGRGCRQCHTEYMREWNAKRRAETVS